jgi:hypothetical protein
MPETPYMTVQEAAVNALGVQDGCNLSGIVNTWRSVLIDALWPEARRLHKGTDWVNRHPVNRLFLEQVAHLQGLAPLSEHQDLADPTVMFYGKAYEMCQKLVNGEEIDY